MSDQLPSDRRTPTAADDGRPSVPRRKRRWPVLLVALLGVIVGYGAGTGFTALLTYLWARERG